ncbi:hydrolase [Formosa sediminum]|uniref:Hydrolase n=1 Tax=Formosa sediminum TaxID=2594004 RepID=A0A516GTD7_9FLAO|nr:hydrolase [Formosa sediminum]QDO94784.1 hydrolase [Formosa sediminum]
MKQRIFMYLFIFSLLLILFQYVNSKNVFEDDIRTIEKSNARVETLTDSITVLEDKIFELSHFNIENNEDAITYFENKGLNVDTLIPFIKDAIYNNNVKGGNPLIPYAANEGKSMLINSIKVLNHKWLITDFSDGIFWGELLVKYEVINQNEVTFEVIDSLLYPLR